MRPHRPTVPGPAHGPRPRGRGCRRRPRPAPRLRRRAFTLVELMVVIAIIGLLAAVVTVNVMGQVGGARRQRVAADMEHIGQAIKLFKLHTGMYPQQLSDLWERPANVAGWGPEPYLDRVPPLDPWQREYRYEYRGGSEYELISYGADGAPGGQGEAADLSSTTIHLAPEAQ